MQDYEANWHHRVITEYLDRFISGDIKRLMIFAPPRHGKSELVSRRTPAYILGKNPKAGIIASSYGSDLARLMNRDVQRIIDSRSYADVFPQTVLSGKNTRTVTTGNWLRNSDIFEIVTHGGYYRGAGVGGAITGMGMQYGIIDDPFKNRQDADSPVVRESVWNWYTSTFRTRLAKDGGILLIVTRWHDDDLAGRLLTLQDLDPLADKWTVLSFPAIAESPMAEYDQRQEGEALWPARFDLTTLTSIRANSEYEWQALYQQRPRARDGGMFKRDWFEIVPGIKGNNVQRVRYWDKAGTKDAGAYTAGVLLALSGGVYYVEDVIMGQWAAAEREAIIASTAVSDSALGYVVTWVEQEPGSGGKESAENTIARLAGYTVYADKVTGDKAVRAEPLQGQAMIGNVKIVKASWNSRYLEIMTAFPTGKIKDPVDATSGAFNKLTNVGLNWGNTDSIGTVAGYVNKWG